MLRPERWMDRDQDEIIYSDEEPEQSDSKSEEEEDEWAIDWDDMECVDEYGEDREKDATTKLSEQESSDEELVDLQLDAVDELHDASKERRERREGSMDDKKESEEEKEEEDPWSRWVGVHSRDEKERERGGEERDEKKRDQTRKTSTREEKKPTLAELVLKGKLTEGEATRDKKNRGVRRERRERRERSPPRRVPSPVRRRESTPSKKVSPRRKDERRRDMSPMRRKISPDRRKPPNPRMKKEKRSPLREELLVSPSYEKKRDRSPRRIPSPSMDRRRNSSPMRRERRPSPSRREKRSPERSERKRGGGNMSRPSSPLRPTMRRDRSPLPLLHPHKRDAIPRLSSPNRTTVNRSGSPALIRMREVIPKISSPNRVRTEDRGRERSPRQEDKRGHRDRRDRSRSPIVSLPRKDLPSLLDVKILPPLSTRMEGRVKREERMERKEEETPKERIERDGRDNQMGHKMEDEKTEKTEERKRHVPIVWNSTGTDAKKIDRSIGHMKGSEMMDRKRKKEEEKKTTVGMAMIPLSMVGRVGKCRIDVAEQPRLTAVPIKSEIGRKKSFESFRGRLQPTELVRIITNNDAMIEQVEEMKQKGEAQLVKEIMEEEGDDEDGGGWLSARLQEGGNGMAIERGDKKMVNPSSAALRLFGRAAASAVSSSTLKDARPVITKEVRSSRETNELFGEEKEGRRMKQNKRSIEERMEIIPIKDKGGKAKKRQRQRVGDKGKLSQQSSLRLLECYY